MPARDPNRHRWSPKFRRLWALNRKEGLQVLRDPSSIVIGVIVPVVLILLFGYGMSLDVKNVPVAIVLEDSSLDAAEIVAGFQQSPYFQPRRVAAMPLAEEMLRRREVDAILCLRSDFTRQLQLRNAPIQIIADGSDANTARIIQAYAQGVITQSLARRAALGARGPSAPVTLRSRLWFNETNESRRFLVPGLVVLVMTLIGALLTSLVMAREWERGTLESLFVTPVRPDEILLSKMIPYFGMGMIGLALCLLAAKFLFDVPFRGSLWILAGASALYLLVALGIGLLISSTAKNQFVSMLLTLIVTFLPAMLLSGILFDLRSMPAGVRLITYALPARYYVALLQTLFLAGNVWGVILSQSLVLAGMAAALMLLIRGVTRKRLA